MTNLPVLKYAAILGIMALTPTPSQAKILKQEINPRGDTLTVQSLGPRAVRVTVHPQDSRQQSNAFYLDTDPYQGELLCDPLTDLLTFADYTLTPVAAADGSINHWEAKASFAVPADECVYGTGQFQDGYLNVKGLPRRLTQVNTQISVPMILSSAGYGILWNNNGLTDYNPCDNYIALTPAQSDNETVRVNVTGTEGNRQEERRGQTFVGELTLDHDGDYGLLLDCGRQMARRHYLEIDGEVLTEADNLWLPPTTSVKKHLSKGTHRIVVKGEKADSPTLYWQEADAATTVFSSPVSQGIDFTVFTGTPDEIIAQMRQLTGEVPMLPKWALGYIHCRERYDTQDELLTNAREFRSRHIPIDLIVQDWQWWGSNGWNAMKFDSKKYPDPKAMTDSVHLMDIRLMLSVWAKVDKSSTLGQQLSEAGHYIPGTDWIDFFSDEAAEAYWQAYRDNLLPTGIDAWWQDATEPENDDLHGRQVAAGTRSGDEVRNVFPIAVNDRVYRGLCEERPDLRPMILTRCGAPGIQRYGVVTWSGDVGNDWQTLERQIKGGLNQSAAGLPWWTYDAGGFFRPGDQYSNEEYQQRMLRWIQCATFLPMMRVHGYMSQTEPWRYPEETCQKFVDAIAYRYHLIPYLYSEAQRVSAEGSTLMRPLVFDFADDSQALDEIYEYMLGSSLLICPVTSADSIMEVYLPEVTGGWYDLFTGTAYAPGKHTVALADTHIPVFVKAGTVLPWIDADVQSTTEVSQLPELTLRVYPGADGSWTLYDDDGVSRQYADGVYSSQLIEWDNATGTLTLHPQKGSYASPVKRYKIAYPTHDSGRSLPNTPAGGSIKLPAPATR